jgi:hypothetical protein
VIGPVCHVHQRPVVIAPRVKRNRLCLLVAMKQLLVRRVDLRPDFVFRMPVLRKQVAILPGRISTMPCFGDR